MSKMRLAIVGAGPAGIYAADLLIKAPRDFDVEIDLFEQLPAPYGLVRYGVAPDHPRIKGIVNALRDVLDRGDIRYFGNVRYGQDISLEDLRRHYHAVIFATGAIRDASLDIPGIDAQGSYGAADFVSWFDGHPDVPRDWPLEAEQVAVIGNGNVALDVARILSKHADQLLETEIPAHIYAQLNDSAVTDVHVFGRRGPAQVKFTPLELRELSHSKDVDIVLYPEDFEFDKASDEAMKTNNQTKTMVSTLTNWLIEQEEREEAPSASRRLHLHFLQSPIEVLGEDGKVTGLKVERNELDGNGGARGTGEFIEYPIQALYRAVGYFGSAVGEIEYDGAKGVLPNVEGRVLDATGTHVPGLYATGWIKRGPVGLIGHTKGDALETINHLLEDLGSLAQPSIEQSIADLLDERGVQFSDWDGWKSLDAHEKELGAAEGTVATRFGDITRDRIKVVEREDMLEFSRAKKLAESL